MAACAKDPEYWTDNKVQEDVDVLAALDIVAKRLLTEAQELQFMQEMNAYLSKQVGYSWAENERWVPYILFATLFGKFGESSVCLVCLVSL